MQKVKMYKDNFYKIYCWLIAITLMVILNSSDNLFSQTWQSTNGPNPTSNQVAALVVDSANNVYAGTIGGGVYVTTNNGTSWTAINSGLSSTNVRALVIQSSGSILAGTDNGVFLSTNSGTNWTQLNNGIGNNRINTLVIDSKGSILAGTRGAGMYVSTDHGSNWTALGLTGINITAIAIDSTGNVFVGTEGLTSGTFGGGVYISYSYSLYNWYQINNGLPSLPINSLVVNSSNNIFAGTYGSGVYMSGDKQSWQQKDTGLPASAGVSSFLINASSRIYAGMAILNTGAYLSTDNGESWTAFGLSANSVSVLTIDTAGYLFAGTYDGGVFRTASTTVVAPPVPTLVRPLNQLTDLPQFENLIWNSSFGATGYRLQLSTDSTFTTTVYDSSKITDTMITFKSLLYETKYFWRVNSSNSKITSDWSPIWKFTIIHAPGWSQVNDSLTNNTIQSLLINSSDYVFAGTYGGGVFRSTNKGAWWNSSGLPGTEVFTFAKSGGNIFAGVGYFSAGAFLSTDQGFTWNSIGLTSSNAVAALAVNSSGNVFAGTYGNVYLSKDNGANWSTINNGLPSNPSILSLAINSSGYVFAGMGYTSTNVGVYLSKDNGSNWSFSGLANCGDINTLAINSSGSIFAGTDKGVFISTDAGVNWTQDGLPDVHIRTISITSDNKVFAGSLNNGVYFSVDNGTNWTQINDGLYPSVDALAFNSTGDIYAATWGRGVYRAKLSIFIPQKTPTLKSPANLSTDLSITPVLSWTAVAGTWSYRLQVSPDSNFSYAVYDTSGINDTSKIAFNLALNTKYFWRVNSSNEFGTSSWSNVWKFTTTSSQAIAITNSATSISQTTATLTANVNPKGLTATVYFDYGTTTSYSQVVIAAESPVNGNSLLGVSAGISNLTMNTLYHYRVRIVNTSGTILGADSTFTTLSTLATTITNPPLKVFTSSATLSGTVNPNGSSTVVKFEYGTTTAYGTTKTVIQSPVSGFSDVDVTASITGLQQGTLYHYRVIATNNSGTGNGYDQTFTTYSTSTQLTHTYTFGDVTKSSSYQLIGIPGNGSIALSSLISTGTPKQDWDAYYDNGNVSNYLVEFDNSSKFSFSPGKGFWVISKNAINLSQPVSTVTLDTGANYSIPLQLGWNIISNPFITTSSWSTIVDLNGLKNNSPILYSWTNSNWAENTDMTPYVGYYFYNSTNLTSLIIPYNSSGKLGKINLSQKTTLTDTLVVKEMEISLMNNSQKITSVFAAVNPKASVDYDQFDHLAPPADFQDESIAIINDSLSISYKKLIKDTRPDIGNGKEFNFVVSNKNGSALKLSFNGLGLFKNYECYLMDDGSKQFYNLNDKNSISINDTKTSKYKLLIGTDSYINDKKAENVPDSYNLFQNYPNPFNPTTTISYALKSASRVKISVYNILGGLVKELLDVNQELGYHQIQFDASKLASGIYIYSIRVNPTDGKPAFLSSKKMVLLK